MALEQPVLNTIVVVEPKTKRKYKTKKKKEKDSAFEELATLRRPW
jgi:hypothetical protein